MERIVSITITVRESRYKEAEKAARSIEAVMKRGAALTYEDRVSEAKEVEKGQFFFCAVCGKPKLKGDCRQLYCGKACHQQAKVLRGIYSEV